MQFSIRKRFITSTLFFGAVYICPLLLLIFIIKICNLDIHFSHMMQFVHLIIIY